MMHKHLNSASESAKIIEGKFIQEVLMKLMTDSTFPGSENYLGVNPMPVKPSMGDNSPVEPIGDKIYNSGDKDIPEIEENLLELTNKQEESSSDEDEIPVKKQAAFNPFDDIEIEANLNKETQEIDLMGFSTPIQSKDLTESDEEDLQIDLSSKNPEKNGSTQQQNKKRSMLSNPFFDELKESKKGNTPKETHSDVDLLNEDL